MTDDIKLQDVVVARFTYRHEAEFAAGFLDDADIPYRLQVDDANLGMTIATPATIWVRGMDLRAALDVLDLPEPITAIEPDPPPSHEYRPERRGRVIRSGSRPARRDGRLDGTERAVAGTLAGAMGASAVWLPLGPAQSVLSTVLLIAAVVLALSALVGRTVAPVRALLSAISGSAP